MKTYGILSEIEKLVDSVVTEYANKPDHGIEVDFAPPDMGDLAINISGLTERKKSEVKKTKAEKEAEQAVVKAQLPLIGQALLPKIKSHPLVVKANLVGNFINVTVDRKRLMTDAIRALSPNVLHTGKSQKIMVEYLSPNTNKPLHLGHVRNGVLGSALAKILSAVGHQVVKADLINDRGIHICKSMLAYKLFGNGATPQSSGMKGDHFVGMWYVRYAEESKNNPALEGMIEEMLRKWEANDPETMSLWETMNGWVYEGFKQTNDRYGFDFDTIYYESTLYKLGKDLVYEGLSKGVFVKDEQGAIRFILPQEKFGTNKDGGQRSSKVLNPDETSVYITQDLGVAVKKVEDFQLDRSIYVVANEQDGHFKALFTILKALGFSWADLCYHFSYGMVELPHGRMKSREGTVVDADDLLNEMKSLATQEILKRGQVDSVEADKRGEAIALAAIKFLMVSATPTRKILFDPEKSLAFEGDTGPYCLYAYARTQNILAKASPTLNWNNPQNGFDLVGQVDAERQCAIEIFRLAEYIINAAESFDPSLVAKGTLRLAKAFNQFYRDCPVICEDVELMKERLMLTDLVGKSLKKGLNLMGIPTLEYM